MASDELASGKQLGPFRLDRRLALGGMAEIWLAEQQLAQGTRSIALKILLAPYAKDPTFRGMFADEVRIASRLTHENIVQVYGSFEVEGHLFQAMEIVDGKDLRRVLSSLARGGDTFPVPLALVVAREIARALSYAHQKRGEDGKPLEIVHRDISPHNLMLTREGGVKVLDFGIASAAERLTRTRTGVIKGKISYMAPEQAMAMGVTARTDIFALAIVLWETLAMQRLFKAETDAVALERVVKAEIPPIRELNPQVPEDAAALLTHMLQQKPANRPESMRTVENALTRILVRHYKEEQTTPYALAAWAANWLDLEPKKTGRFVAPDLPPMDAEVPDAPTKSDLSGPSPAIDQTLAMAPADPLGASGGTSVGELSPELDLPIESGMDPTERVAPIDRASLEKKPEQRLPRRSEIIRAVDMQPTAPLMVDPAALAGPVGLPKVIDADDTPEIQSQAPARVTRVQDAGRVQSGKVVAGETTLPPAKVVRRTFEPTMPIRDERKTTPFVPSSPPPAPPQKTDPAWVETSDEHGFAPVKVGFTDAIKALDPQSRPPLPPLEPAAPRPPVPQTAVPRWVYPTFAAFALTIIILLVLLLMKE